MSRTFLAAVVLFLGFLLVGAQVDDAIQAEQQLEYAE